MTTLLIITIPPIREPKSFQILASGTLIPEDVKGLIVAEKSISVTNLVNGATRLQPVMLQTGQAAGALGALAVLKKVQVSEVPVRDVQNVLLDAGGYLLPYLDVTVNHPWFRSLQRIGATGILKGEGKSQGWSNQTWFRAYDLTLLSDLGGMGEFWKTEGMRGFNDTLSVGEIIDIIRMAGQADSTVVNEQALQDALEVISGGNPTDLDRKALRGETALLIDMALDPFNRFCVDIYGSLIKTNVSRVR
ncbi:MAG: FAD-dependent oxidoreductase [Bacteroidales bacterium]|nr:FAD-dependent oxidoreductase [Bacteroidales bacterium]